MKPNYAKLYRKSTYTFHYLANSTNKLTQIFKRLALGNDASGWIGKEQPFAPIAPPMNGGSNVQA
jgi:hypothetical protein